VFMYSEDGVLLRGLFSFFTLSHPVPLLHK
jgi:hypothetical protein